MSHPETYYDAKRALLDTAAKKREHLAPAAVEAILAALGWPQPEPVRDERGRVVKVYSTDLRHALPKAFIEAHRDGRRTYNTKHVGYIVGTSKQDVGDRTTSTHWVKSQRVSGVFQIDPTDLAYPLAAAAPADHAVIIITGDGAPPSAPILFPLADLEISR